jgi:hypothetical protein
MSKLEIRDGDDWVVMEFDGVRVYTGHRPSWNVWKEILERVGVTVDLRFGQFGEDGNGDDDVFTEEGDPLKDV